MNNSYEYEMISEGFDSERENLMQSIDFQLPLLEGDDMFNPSMPWVFEDIQVPCVNTVNDEQLFDALSFPCSPDMELEDSQSVMSSSSTVQSGRSGSSKMSTGSCVSMVELGAIQEMPQLPSELVRHKLDNGDIIECLEQAEQDMSTAMLKDRQSRRFVPLSRCEQLPGQKISECFEPEVGRLYLVQVRKPFGEAGPQRVGGGWQNQGGKQKLKVQLRYKYLKRKVDPGFKLTCYWLTEGNHDICLFHVFPTLQDDIESNTTTMKRKECPSDDEEVFEDNESIQFEADFFAQEFAELLEQPCGKKRRLE